MHWLRTINQPDDIPLEFQGTPISALLEYHNLKKPHNVYGDAQLLIGMCMDHRKKMDIPENFAYIIRTGGANLRYSEFKVSYAIAVGGVQYIALIGHTHCGMVNLMARKKQFVEGLSERAGWTTQAAEEHFFQNAPMFEIGNEVDFIRSETKRLSLRYPSVRVAPLLYKVEDNLLYWIEDGSV